MTCATIVAEPPSGKLKPGEFEICKLIFTAGKAAQLLNSDIILNVVNEDEKVIFVIQDFYIFSETKIRNSKAIRRRIT